MTTKRLALALVLFVVSVPVLIAIMPWLRHSSPGATIDPRYKRFVQMANDGRTKEALELGNVLLNTLLKEKPDDPGLTLLTERLETAEQIGTRIAGGIQSSQTALLKGLAGMDDLGLPASMPQGGAASETLLSPAREVYWTHLRTFTDELPSENLSAREAEFAGRYYDLRVQDSILEIVHHMVLADPNSSEYVCHVVVLPLLYLHGRDDAWNQMESVLALLSSEMLDISSRFALLQIERPEAALALAQYEARAKSKDFARVRWAFDTADACVTNHRPDLAEKLLCTIIRDTTSQDTASQLRLKIADGYARCGDCATAAQKCGQIVADLPETSLYGRITATHLGYLAREEDTQQVIAGSEAVLNDPRCKPYLAQILYLRWWALHKANRPEEAVQVAQRLMQQYQGNPCIAPVQLERATDALAHQEYNKCRELLTELTEAFPETESAKRAQDILTRLKGSGIE